MTSYLHLTGYIFLLKKKKQASDSKLYLLDNEFLSRQLPGEVVDHLKFENHNEGTQYLHGIFQKTG